MKQIPANTPIPEDIFEGWSILVVDDEPDSLHVVSHILNYYGANPYLAIHGKEALNLLRKTCPRFILCDLSMPIMDGWGLIQHLKNNRTTEGIPIIALTAHALKGDPEKILLAGFDGYIDKPLNAGNFIPILLNILRHVPDMGDKLPEIALN